MKNIWKYPLRPGCTEHNMPQGARVLTVQTQHEDICLWALVDPSKPQQRKEFLVYGTGHQIPDDLGRYIGTVQLGGGALVWHVFEKPNANSASTDGKHSVE